MVIDKILLFFNKKILTNVKTYDRIYLKLLIIQIGGRVMYKNSWVHYLTKILVDVMFFGGILICLALPYIVGILERYYGYNSIMISIFDVVLVPSGLGALYFLWQLKIIFKTLIGGNPFVSANITCLRKMSVCCFIIAVIFLARAVFYFTFEIAAVILVFIVGGLFCLTLKDLFKQAVSFKEENDLTV